MKRLVLVIATLCIATSAFANAAMGLALEMFEFRTWVVYVVAMLGVEAWMVGRWIGMSWFKSIGLAIVANAFTAFCCPGVLAPFLHYSYAGTNANPNPLLNAVYLLTSFGLVSAFFESFPWMVAGRKKDQLTIVGRVFAAHLAGVPIALCILLIPSRPYVGLEAFANGARRGTRFTVARDVARDLMDGKPVPNVSSAEELFRHYTENPSKSDRLISSDWVAAYQPHFSRFSTGESRSDPIEFNRKVVGKKITQLPDATWLLRWKSYDGRIQGVILRCYPKATPPFADTAYKSGSELPQVFGDQP